jgi:putative colanic acid biosysnthesis UDP-glucose lipid carrier transferase
MHMGTTYGLFFKRIFDIVFSLIATVVILSWLMPVFALIIRLGSRGNPIFVQKRVGKNRKIFKCYKFRSMRINLTPEIQAVEHDERITRVGRFLRYSGLDEFPQFINILLGQMSVVGPRPHMVAHDEMFEKMIPQYSKRHKVKPGITGLAQIKGCRGSISNSEQLEARTRYDIFYVANMNLFLDVYIIAVSIADMLRGGFKATQGT